MSPRPKKTSQDKLTLGKYVLDSLSAGMYSHPLMALREYIQNSADSIDCLPGIMDNTSINIIVDGRKKLLTINDNGTGIPAHKAKSTLLNIGCSEKDPTLNRGFRGIGRLGGLGYCDELRFTTKSQGEDVVSLCVWDCKKLRQLIVDPSHPIDVELLVKDITAFRQYKYTDSPDNHFFIVEMEAMHNGRNELLNVPAIRSYLSQVAPVPFHKDFSFGQSIEKEIVNRIKSYRTYRISVNGEQIYKPYKDTINLNKGNNEIVKKVKFIELQGESGRLAFGWLGELSLQGTISALSDVDCLRVRYGNIMIGNKETLSSYFREKRFNNYLFGEIHVCGNGLIPNSRRDDFEDSNVKDELFSIFIREIGIPLSREIRNLSTERSKVKSTSTLVTLFEDAARITKYGYISELQKEHVIKRLNAVDGNYSVQEKQLASKFLRDVMKSQHILSTADSRTLLGDDLVKMFNKTLEIVYSETSNREESERILGKLYRALSEQPNKSPSP